MTLETPDRRDDERDSPTWEITRRWLILSSEGEPDYRTTQDLIDFDSLTLLGSAGIGKTVEAKRLAAHERSFGIDVRERRLAEHSGSSDELKSFLAKFSEGADAQTSLHLDALDEAMMSVKRSGLVLSN